MTTPYSISRALKGIHHMFSDSLRCIFAFSLVLGLSIVLPSPAAGAPDAKLCASGKMNAARNYASCIMKFEVKALKKDTNAEYLRCEVALARAWSRLERPCGEAALTEGLTAPDVLALADTTSLALASAAGDAAPLIATTLCTGSNVLVDNGNCVPSSVLCEGDGVAIQDGECVAIGSPQVGCTTIANIRANGIPTEAACVENVLVTAITDDGFYAQDTAGGTLAGIRVVVSGGQIDELGISPGDLVDVSGIFDEYEDWDHPETQAQIEVPNDGSVSTVASGYAIPDNFLSGTAAASDAYESQSVCLENLRIGVGTTTGADTIRDAFGASLRVDTSLYAPSWSPGDTVDQVCGIVTIDENGFGLAARSPTDIGTITSPPPPSSDLVAGDMAIIGIHSDSPSGFSMVVLRAGGISAGTEIFVTDNGVLDNCTMRPGEGILQYIAPTVLPQGTVIRFDNSAEDFDTFDGGFNLSTAGDQVLLYQGSSSQPEFLFAVQSNSSQWQTGADDSNQSAVPCGLTAGVNAVAVGAGPDDEDEFDNAYFDPTPGFFCSTAASCLAAIADPINWTGSNPAVDTLILESIPGL
ncbi:MAG: hypothetical protein P8K76_03570 [Candidatus Binatia bacterium]|nr:hypothetical protein [Candidatus Binatia bacterium]